MSYSQLMEVTVDIMRSSISTMKPKAIKSLMTSSILLDYTMIITFVTSVNRPADIFIKANKNGKIECLP